VLRSRETSLGSKIFGGVPIPLVGRSSPSTDEAKRIAPRFHIQQGSVEAIGLRPLSSFYNERGIGNLMPKRLWVFEINNVLDQACLKVHARKTSPLYRGLLSTSPLLLRTESNQIGLFAATIAGTNRFNYCNFFLTLLLRNFW